jgi:hypothetical protein
MSPAVPVLNEPAVPVVKSHVYQSIPPAVVTWIPAGAICGMLPIGGFLGNVPAPALATLQADISRGYVRAFVLPVSPPGPDPRVRWTESHCTRQPRPPNLRPVPYANFFCGGPAPASRPAAPATRAPAA